MRESVPAFEVLWLPSELGLDLKGLARTSAVLANQLESFVLSHHFDLHRDKSKELDRTLQSKS